MYHSVSPDASEFRVPYYETVTDPDSFERQMNYLHRNNYSVLDLETASARLSGDDKLPEKAVVITFDDGYEDFLVHAWPVLRRYDFTATVFLPTAYISDEPRKSFNNRLCLTWPEVRMLAAAGIRFGGHTVTHRKLALLPEAELDEELAGCRRDLEVNLGGDFRTFASPYAFPQADASFVKRYRASLQKAGYTTAVTTCIGRARLGDDPLTIKRLPMNRFDDVKLLEAKLKGSYDWLSVVQGSIQAWKKCTS
jgi:peptidoglycan/xylan/chitin deacetylase (PgdA/CDA1 family)